MRKRAHGCSSPFEHATASCGMGKCQWGAVPGYASQVVAQHLPGRLFVQNEVPFRVATGSTRCTRSNRIRIAPDPGLVVLAGR